MNTKKKPNNSSLSIKRYFVIPMATIIVALVFVMNATVIKANASTGIIRNSNPYASNPKTSIKSSWQKTYYKSLSETNYLKITLKKSTFTVKLVQKGEKGKIFEKGYYKTWLSEAMDISDSYPGKLMFGKKSEILWSFERKDGGNTINIEPQKHLYDCAQLEYIPGTYYKSLKLSRKHI